MGVSVENTTSGDLSDMDSMEEVCLCMGMSFFLRMFVVSQKPSDSCSSR